MKPVDLAYGVDDGPPWLITIFSALQHAGLMSVYLLFPLVVGREAGAPPEVMAGMLALSMLVIALATVIQAARIGPVGSGYLCPAVFTAAYLGPSVGAAKAGGLALVWGMTMFAGAFEAALSRGLHRLRALLPTEISGLVVFLVGLTNGVIGARYLLLPGAEDLRGSAWIAGAVCLAATVALNVWTKGHLRTFCLLIGMVAGYAVALEMGFVPLPSEAIREAAPLALPSLDHLAWQFDPGLAPAFAVAALAAALKTIAVVTLCQRMNDAEWKRPDMKNISRGVLADGVGTAVAGALGAVGVNSSSPNVGLASATGIASRVVAYAIAALFVLLALSPLVAQVLISLPRSIIGAGLLFTACFVLLSGMQIMASRMLDVRRSLVIGFAILAAIVVELIPQASEAAPVWATPLFGSSLVAGTATALGLNLLFRIGVRRVARLVLDPASYDPRAVQSFVEGQGGAWAARGEVVGRAHFAVAQLVEALADHGVARSEVTIEISFDEVRLQVEATYRGTVFPMPDRRPAEAEILTCPDAVQGLTGYLLRRNADRAEAGQIGDQAVMRFTFDH